MATREHPERETPGGLAAVLGRTGILAVIALVETVALGIWLLLVRTAPMVSVATAAGFAVLAGGLVATHFLTDVAVNGLEASLPGPPAIAVVLGETGAWTLWLATADRVGGLAGIAVAGAVFAAVLVPQHTLADNVHRGEGLAANLADFDALGFSVVQAMGATVWLASVLRGDLVTPWLVDADAAFGNHLPFDLAAVDPGVVGLVALATALFVEGFVASSFSRHG